MINRTELTAATVYLQETFDCEYDNLPTSMDEDFAWYVLEYANYSLNTFDTWKFNFKDYEEDFYRMIRV